MTDVTIAATRAERAFDLDAPAPPWDHDPSAWTERLPICLLAGVGVRDRRVNGLEPPRWLEERARDERGPAAPPARA